MGLLLLRYIAKRDTLKGTAENYIIGVERDEFYRGLQSEYE